MALGFTELATISTSTANAESYLAASAGTPVAGDLLITFVSTTATTAAGGMTGVWTWNKIRQWTYNGGADSQYIFYAYASAATPTQVTFTCTGDGATSCEIYTFRVTGSSGIVTADIRQWAVATGTAANPVVTMPSAIKTGNGCLSMCSSNGTAPTIYTAPTNWAGKVEAGTGTAPKHATALASRVSGETGTTVTWTRAGTDPWGLVVLELNVLGGLPTRQPGGGAYSSPMTY